MAETLGFPVPLRQRFRPLSITCPGFLTTCIAGRLKQEAGSRDSVCHETIYRHVYGPEGREDGLYRHLPKARRRRGSRYGRRPRATAIPRERWIENRPAE